MLIDHAWIAAHIPHQHEMCLLDRVLEWNEQQVRCSAFSHRDLNNPLRSHGRLAAVCGIEYGAQAMAVHGALVDAQLERPRAGYLASVRNVVLHADRLDDIESDLLVEAERFSGDANNILYDFRIYAKDRLLLSGRAAVVIDANACGPL